LWIVRSTLMTLGGSVRFETEVGRGTTFIVSLPVSPS
jgi:chemotaxis protein histidine kinase CheA